MEILIECQDLQGPSTQSSPLNIFLNYSSNLPGRDRKKVFIGLLGRMSCCLSIKSLAKILLTPHSSVLPPKFEDQRRLYQKYGLLAFHNGGDS